MKLSTMAAVAAALAALAGPRAATAQSLTLPLQPAPSAGASLQLPGINAGSVTVLGPSTARIAGSIDPNGLATSVRVEYGTGGLYDLRTPSVGVGAGVDPTQVVLDLLDLQPGSSYNYRIVVDSAAGTVVAGGGSGGPGASGTFTTPPAMMVDPRTGRPSVVANGVSCTITGSNAADDIRGTARRDVICGLGGNDKLRGLAGGDRIYGGPGSDRIDGGAGRDVLYGNAGDDRISGGRGNDRIFGHKGRDRVSAGSGSDSIVTSLDRRGGDHVNGGRGRDRARVNPGDRVRAVEHTRRSRR